jgi:hypothetical protein
VPVTHPNDLLAGQSATFVFLLDGKPAAGLEVTLDPGRHPLPRQARRDAAEDRCRGPRHGELAAAGVYWISATHGARNEGGSVAQPARRASYSATLEVLPQ